MFRPRPSLARSKICTVTIITIDDILAIAVLVNTKKRRKAERTVAVAILMIEACCLLGIILVNLVILDFSNTYRNIRHPHANRVI